MNDELMVRILQSLELGLLRELLRHLVDQCQVARVCQFALLVDNREQTDLLQTEIVTVLYFMQKPNL